VTPALGAIQVAIWILDNEGMRRRRPIHQQQRMLCSTVPDLLAALVRDHFLFAILQMARRPRRSWSLSPQAHVDNVRPDPLIAGREPCILRNRYAIDAKEMVDRDVTFNAFDDRE
jgi:hypothetical protein